MEYKKLDMREAANKILYKLKKVCTKRLQLCGEKIQNAETSPN